MHAHGQHERWMRRALELAREGEGLTRPNPPVGAVWIQGGRLVGEGYHRRAGGAHAEIEALRGGSAHAGTLYVTLEPCSTWGRTAPCTEAILRAGIRRVVVATRDPNPAHAGRGLSWLRRHGVKVVEGVCREEAGDLINPFRTWVLEKRPFVTLKLGMSLDGDIADRNRASKWITGPAARRDVQALRRRADAILVGSETVRRDNPRLVPRPARGRKPYRVILDGKGTLTTRSEVLRDAHVSRTLMVTSRACPRAAIERWGRAGAQVLVLNGPPGRLPIRSLLRRLGKMDILHLLCEGGGQLAASLVRAGVVNEYRFYIAPCLVGGTDAVRAIGGKGWLMKNRPRLRFLACTRIEDDLCIRAVPLA